MTRLEELTLMIRRGWGDVPQNKIPLDWQKSWGPGEHYAEAMRESRDRYKHGIQLRNMQAWRPRRAVYLGIKDELLPFPVGSQFRFPFSFSETG